MVGSRAGQDDRAVSEMTAVAILVGLTVIVTASVGISVLFIEQDSGGIPSANFSFTYYSGNAMLVVDHAQGDQIEAGRILMTGDGGPVTWAEVDGNRNESDLVDAGAVIQLSDNNAWGQPVRTGDTVEVYYDHGDGNRTLLSAWEGS